MKGKLHKESEGYYLSASNKTIGTTRPLLNFDIVEYKLSLKNCQAIELGYDLDELAYDFSWNYQSDPNYGDTIDIFKAGFQKAIELMSDKKFSEADLKKAWSEGYHRKVDEINSGKLNYFDDLIQSLQQTEWDVEVYTVPALSNNGNVYYGDIPKLDENGCLILKRI